MEWRSPQNGDAHGTEALLPPPEAAQAATAEHARQARKVGTRHGSSAKANRHTKKAAFWAAFFIVPYKKRKPPCLRKTMPRMAAPPPLAAFSAGLPACAKYTRRYIFTSAPLPVHNGTAFRKGIAIPFVRQKARDVVPKRLPQRVYAVQIHLRVAYRLLRIAAAQKGGTVLCQAATGFERLRRGFVAIKDKCVKVLRNSELYSNPEEWPTSESMDYKPFKKKGRY